MAYYPKIKIAPSVLAADYSRLADDLKDVEKRGVDFFHIDIMDGHFVPNITIGPQVVKTVRGITNLILDVHLMIEDPDFFMLKFIDAGADIINFHVEPFIENNKLNLKKLLKVYNKAKGVRKGLTINPPTSADYFKDIFRETDLDFILIMSVNPGFGGQSFMPDVLAKAERLRACYDFKGDIQIDGGINQETSKYALKSGCNILVAGTYIFNSEDRDKAINSLRNNILDFEGGKL